MLARIAKGVAGRIEPDVEQPTAEGLLQLLEAQMQRPRGDAELRCHKIRRQRGVMQIAPGEVEQRLELQFGLHAIDWVVSA